MKTRDGERSGMIAFMIIASAICVAMGFQGWAVNGIPTHYLGFIFMAMAILGLFKVNIWAGGPFDPRRDAQVLAQRESEKALPRSARPKNWNSVVGTGALLYGIRHAPDDRTEFTVWFCIVYIPIFPISSWSAGRVGEMAADGFTIVKFGFADIRPISADWVSRAVTLVSGWLIAVASIAPAILVIMRTDGRAATTTECVMILAFAGLPTVAILLAERHRRRILLRPPVSPADAAGRPHPETESDI